MDLEIQGEIQVFKENTTIGTTYPGHFPGSLPSA